jgi:uncharacterized protein with PQ loop repeat
MEIIGWIGSFLFAFCCVPQSWQCYRQGHARGLDWMFILMWLFGEILTTIYVWPKQDLPLLLNYFFNMLCISVIVKYKLWERKGIQ